MSELYEREMRALNGKEVLVVMNDGHTYRGTLADFDEKWIKLDDVSEGTTSNVKGWEEPAVSMSFVDKVVTFRGVETKQDSHEVLALRDVLVQVSQVLRIWALTTDNLERPKHYTVQKSRRN